MEAREKQYTEGAAYYTMQTQWLPKFLRQNYDWIKTVLKPFIEKKKQDLQEYLEHVVTENYKCDEVGLFLFARMFHIQIGVIVNGVAWTTHFKQDLKQCDFVLGYKGCCQFVLLEKLQPDETLEEGMSLDVIEVPQYSTPVPSPAKPKIQRKPVDLTKATVQRKKQCRNQQCRESHRKKREQNSSTSTQYKLRSSDRKCTTRNSKRAGFYNAGKSVTKAIATSQGVVSVTTVGLQKRKKRSKSYSCYWCSEKFPKHKDLNQHIIDKHPTQGFHCRFCGKNFHSYSGRYKHMMVHIGFKYQCSTCEQVFRYPYELRDHQKVHTNLGKFFCKEKNCKDHSYTTKKALQQHQQVHSDKVFTCDVCQKEFKTKGYLQQHFWIHDKNFLARCGEKCKNPSDRRKHQKDCGKCDARKRKLHAAAS